MEDKIKKLEELLEVHCQTTDVHGDEYFRGMANGIIFSLGILQPEKQREYLDMKKEKPLQQLVKDLSATNK